MEKQVSKLKVIGFYTFILVLSIFNMLIYLSMRPFWYFINRDTKIPIFTNLPFTALVFSVYALFFVYSLILFLIYLIKKKSFIIKPPKINLLTPPLIGAALSFFTYYLFTRMVGDQYLVTNYLKSAEPYLFIIILLFLLIFTNPDTKFGKIPILYYGGIIFALIFMLLNIINFGEVKITSGPNLQLIGSHNLAIIWTTDRNSTAFVEYGTDQNNLKRAYASTDGLIDANTKTHRVIIPYAKNSSIIYRVLSRKINKYYQNNVEYGNTVVSNFKKFTDANLNSSFTFYTFDDVHENVDLYKHFLNNQNYDYVFLNGDSINSADTASEIIHKMLKPLSVITNGEKPFYFVRGNHETRGAAARELPNYLALPNNHYYYTLSIGRVFGVVLDSSEDKLDNHEEYANLADYNNYRQEQTKWLQSVYESSSYKNAKYRIAFVHIPLNFYDRDEGDSYLKTYEKNWRDLLNKMKIDVVFSGHTHVPAIIEPDAKEFTYPTIIGGGPTDHQKEYIAIKTEVTSDKMSIFFVGFDGSMKKIYEIQR